MATLLPLAAVGAAVYMAPGLERMMAPEPEPEKEVRYDPIAEERQRVFEQFMSGGQIAPTHQHQAGAQHFDIANPPVDTYQAGTDYMEDPEAISRIHDGQSGYFDWRMRNFARNLSQQQPDVYLPRKKMPFVHATTREIRHPTTGATTGFINHAFMPEHPNEMQATRATEILRRQNLAETFDQRMVGRAEFRHAPGQSFRYSEYG